ncbi:hypothetical protein C8J57DRAFT_1193019 [Mycena rebaudengoi]|nr:hypothetical protein C8J57DRAFT_1193019 [Mycena rebaudengoi]
MFEHCSAVPSDTQIPTIRNVIELAEERIHANDLEIARLQRLQVELRNFVNDHTGMLSVLRQFPNEVLTEIFLLYVHGTPSEKETSSASPWIISKVCSNWRAVALSSPLVWSRFVVDPPRPRTRLLSAQLERSRNALIYLDFQSKSFLASADSLSALDLFLAVSTRWRHAVLDLKRADMLHLHAFTGIFPALQTLVIRNRDPQEVPGAALTVLPALTELELNYTRTLVQLRRTLPFSQLRKCTINNCAAEDALHILSCVPPDTDFTLRKCHFGTGDVLGSDETTSRIGVLRMYDCEEFVMYYLMCKLFAPALTRVVAHRVQNIARHLPVLLANAPSPLTHLSFRNTDPRAEELRSVLELTPDVVELEQDDASESLGLFERDADAYAEELDAILNVLTTSSIAPQLRRLVLRGDKWDAHNVVCMLYSRVPVLESVQLNIEVPAETVEELRARGMEVSTKRLPPPKHGDMRAQIEALAVFGI